MFPPDLGPILGPHFGGTPGAGVPRYGPVLMGKSFACPHVYRYCSSGGGPKMGYLGSPIWAIPAPVLMGNSFACPHVSWYCCSGGGPKMGYLGSPNMGSPGLVDMG